jgi:hypothetical protein
MQVIIEAANSQVDFFFLAQFVEQDHFADHGRTHEPDVSEIQQEAGDVRSVDNSRQIPGKRFDARLIGEPNVGDVNYPYAVVGNRS